jgi:TolA-binding protein
MSEAIIVAIITGGLSLAGVVATCYATAKKNETALKVSQAVMESKIVELTREVRLHNGFAEKIPVIQEQIKVINHRIEDLEDFHKPTNTN